MKTGVAIAGLFFVITTAFSAPPDNGVPASEAEDWRSVWDTKTGSAWRTKQNELTDEKVSFNPLTSEIWRNPVTDKAEAVLREEWMNDGIEASKRQAAKLLPDITLDNGIPVSAARQFASVADPATSSESRTVMNSVTGQKITFNPQTSELWKNPVTGRWEAIVRGSSEDSQNTFKEARATALPVGTTRGKPEQDRVAAEARRREDQRREAAAARGRAAAASSGVDQDEPDHRFYNGNYVPGTGDPNASSSAQTPSSGTNFTIPQLHVLSPAFAPSLAPRPAVPPPPRNVGSPGFGSDQR